MAFKEKIGVFSQPGALPGDALEDLIGQIEGLDMDAVREEIENAGDDHNHDHEGHDHDHADASS
jgi:thioredoxin 1